MSFHLINDAEKQKSYEEASKLSIGELASKKEELQGDMHRALEQAGENLDISKIDCLGGSTADEKRAALTDLHSNLAGHEQAYGEKMQMKKAADDIAKANSGNGSASDESSSVQPEQAPLKGKSEGIYEAFKAYADAHGIEIDRSLLEHKRAFSIDLSPEILNTTFSTGAGWAPFVEREGRVIMDAVRPLQVIDLMPMTRTDMHSIKYMEETTGPSESSNNAQEKAEATSLQEGEFALTERTVSVRKIGIHVPVTEEQLDDVPEVQAYMNNRLPFAVRQRLDRQIMAGNGTSPNIQGILDVSGTNSETLTVGGSKLTKPMNSLLKAKTTVELTGRAMASAYVLHHYFWQAIMLSESTSGGFYLGSPAGGFSPQVWGLPVAVNDVLDAGGNNKNAGVCGDFANYSALRVRKEADIEFGTSGDDFVNDIIRLKATMRAAAVWYRPAAFTKIVSPASGTPAEWTI